MYRRTYFSRGSSPYQPPLRLQPDPAAYDAEYARKVDSGEISEYDFVHNGPGGGGYGFAQWTFYTLKQGLYSFAKSKGVSIANEDMQVQYLITEVTGSGEAVGYADYVLTARKGFTVSDWKDASTPEAAAEAFCWIFENPGGDGDVSYRKQKAREYYERFKGQEAPIGAVSGSASSLLAAIDKTARYLCENNYTYKATDNVSYTFPIANSPNRRTLSCSSFVQECLLQAGYSQCSGGEKLWARTNSSLSLRDFNNLNIKVQLITDMTQLQPGDIVQYGTGYHVVFVYSVQSNGVIVKGVPEVLNNNHGFNGVLRPISFLQGKNAYALRIIGGT